MERARVNGAELEYEIGRGVRQRLGGNKAPRALHFVNALPKTANGKIQHVKLREQAATLR